MCEKFIEIMIMCERVDIEIMCEKLCVRNYVGEIM